MYTDEQFRALEWYLWQKGIGDGSRPASSVLDGKHTMFLLTEGAIVHIANDYFRITPLGETIYWLNSYHILKNMIYQTIEYTKLAMTDAKDYDAIKNRLEGILMILYGKIQFEDGKITHYWDESVLPDDLKRYLNQSAGEKVDPTE